MFAEKRSWYRSAKRSFERWGVPVHVQMAIMQQESGFRANAKPPRMRFLGMIPTFRPSSAYGYGQVKDDTWRWYRNATGNSGADRDDFGDAADFVGWYCNYSHERLGISKWDARNMYLAYHEGHGGYAAGTFRSKRWLLKVASRVQANADRYRHQLESCREELERGRWWPSWLSFAQHGPVSAGRSGKAVLRNAAWEPRP